MLIDTSGEAVNGWNERFPLRNGRQLVHPGSWSVIEQSLTLIYRSCTKSYRFNDFVMITMRLVLSFALIVAHHDHLKRIEKADYRLTSRYRLIVNRSNRLIYSVRKWMLKVFLSLFLVSSSCSFLKVVVEVSFRNFLELRRFEEVVTSFLKRFFPGYFWRFQ